MRQPTLEDTPDRIAELLFDADLYDFVYEQFERYDKKTAQTGSASQKKEWHQLKEQGIAWVKSELDKYSHSGKNTAEQGYDQLDGLREQIMKNYEEELAKKGESMGMQRRGKAAPAESADGATGESADNATGASKETADVQKSAEPPSEGTTPCQTPLASPEHASFQRRRPAQQNKATRQDTPSPATGSTKAKSRLSTKAPDSEQATVRKPKQSRGPARLKDNKIGNHVSKPERTLIYQQVGKWRLTGGVIFDLTLFSTNADKAVIMLKAAKVVMTPDRYEAFEAAWTANPGQQNGFLDCTLALACRHAIRAGCCNSRL